MANLIGSRAPTLTSTQVDWHQYEPNAPMSPSSYLDSFMMDYLENLLGPWDSYPFGYGGEEVVDDLKVTADEPGAVIEDVFDIVGDEEGELPMVSIEIPATYFGPTRCSSRRFRSRE